MNIELRTPRVSNRRVSFSVRRSMFIVRCFLFLLLASLTRAQTPLSNLLYTVGTTINSSGADRSYLILDSFDGVSARGKRFAVYGKPGAPTNAATYTLRGTMTPQTDIGTINNLLTQSTTLGQNLSSLNDGLALVLHKISGITNQTLAQKVSTAVQSASTDNELDEFLHLLALGNPGFQMCVGRAFTETIAGVTTYEVRELSPASGAAGDVVGRVTITPGAPVVLPAPGRPFQVVTNNPSDHLRVRLRWGTPLELRRLSVLNLGFNLWRIPRAIAEAGNFHVTPPTPAQLLSNPNFTRANRAAVATTTDYSTGSGAGAADDPADRLTYFFADNGRGSGSPAFTDGQEFYYFATARDLLARDGLVSPGGLARACRRIPPGPPTDARVENTVLLGTTNQPRLMVTWLQNTTATDLVTQYWIYRWPNPTMMYTNDSRPLTNRIGVVTHIPGTNRNSFVDNATGAFTVAGLSNAWYTVRAMSQGACDPLLSPHAGPAWGVLRQRDAPLATDGTLIGSCGTPVVMFQNFATNTITADTQNWHLRFTCVRRDAGIAWVKFNVTNIENDVDVIGPLYFPPDSDTVQWDYESAASITSQARQIYVGCSVGTTYDQVSQEVTCIFNTPISSTQQREAIFFAGDLLATALSSTDPLLIALNGGNTFCTAAYYVTPDASGMVAMQFSVQAGVPLLIQSLSSNTWNDIAVVTPDSNNVYWVSYPACLVGPLPNFRGCTLNLPGDPGCDQHIARASGSGAIAPVRVRFHLTPRTREYRVYRRIDEGPMTLIAQGAAVYDPTKPTKTMETKDEAMPPSAARLCYFVQLLDEHGNGSPLAFIGCLPVKPVKLPRPVLAEPQPVGTVGSPQVSLNWFCPTSGVARFQFKIHRVNPPDPTAPGFTGPKLTAFLGYDKSSVFAGLSKLHIAFLQFSEAYFTTPIGPNFGPGPQFSLTANVQADVEYEITVAPVDDQGHVHQNSTSEALRFTWVPPVVLATVPWPKRLLPPIRQFEPNTGLDFEPRVKAAVFVNFNGGLYDRRYPVGVRIGQLNNSLFFRSPNTYFESNVGTNTYIRYSGFSTIVRPDPHHALFHSRSAEPSLKGQAVLPMVLYRQQVTNALFPKVSGDVTQVSPLIERIPWTIDANQDVTIPDRLFAMNGETYYDQTYSFLYVRDQQPVQLGARYSYFILRFNAKHEVQEIIPAGEVELPVN